MPLTEYAATPNDHRPDCPVCKVRMSLTRMEPAGIPAHDLRTFECPNCNGSQKLVIKFG